jgi:streptomycin 6-kinase
MDFSSPTVGATRDRLIARFGEERVEPWWASLPAAMAELAERWELVLGDDVGRGNNSLVVRCRADGGQAVLKLTPETEIAAAEASALRSWEATGRVPQVWGFDAAASALLLEAIPNETPLWELGTPVEPGDVAGLIGELHRTGIPALDTGVAPLAERVEFIFQHWIGRHGTRVEAVTRAVPVERLRRGRELARELAADPGVPVLLHGDLHPGNVLDGGAERGLVAIDPRPCVGEAAVDAIDWVFWAVDDPRAWEPRSRELAHLLGLDHERLWAWCAAFAAMLATARAARGAPDEEIGALLALAP